jgi:hypothetical protein
MRLDDIDWAAALGAVRERRAVANGSPQRTLADAESLSALFARTFEEGAARIARARDAEPLNPLHALRLALLHLRFGQWDAALELCQSLQEALPGLALPTYVRALATLRQEEPKRAANIAQELITSHPKFGLALFLQAEANLRTAGKGVKKVLTGLPRGAAYVPAWADLVVKMAVSGSDEATKLAAQLAADRATLPADSRAQALAAQVTTLAGAEPKQLEERLAAVPSGSRGEEIILLLIHDRLQKGGTAEGVTRLRRLAERFPERRAVRRLYVALLTRLAMEEAGKDRYAEALRLVERCLRLEPHETVHYQNRAALFTLMREAGAYHDAWFELNRHQYRLALMGKISPADALRLAKPHRLFAQQARLNAEGPSGRRRKDHGVFAEEVRNREGGESVTLLVLNQERVDDDPDLLRQWMHHHRAELVFSHWALGWDPRRFLLYPENTRIARARLEGLGACAKSLAVLVREEGARLAEQMVRHWGALAGRIGSSYVPDPDDPDAVALQGQYLETFADLALLCLTWRPDGRRPELIEEVLNFLNAMAPFFDERLLHAAFKEKSGQPPYPVRMLAGYIDDALGLDKTQQTTLTDDQRARVAHGLAAELLVRAAFRTYEAFRGAQGAAGRALAFAERARKLDPENVQTQLTAARFLLLGEYYDEARAALAEVRRSPRARAPEVASEVEDLKKFLDERRKADEVGLQREFPLHDAAPAGACADRVADLEREIERFPSSIQAYEELVHVLAAAGRFEDAVDWSERAMAQCLGREGQVRARSLNLEVLGVRVLAERDQNAARLYLTGARRPALEILETIPKNDERPYPLGYLLGNCLLAVNRPEDARQSFEWALGRCERQLHRAVLRRLASDIDQAYLMVARRAIQDHVKTGAYEAALQAAADVIARLRRPEAGLIDLARLHLEAAVAALGAGGEALPRLVIEAGRWSGRLAEACAPGDDLERARRLVTLAREADPAAAQQADVLLQKIAVLAEQAALAGALQKSGELLRTGRFDEALAALDAAGPSAAAEPRVLRQRALLLLKLERFADADAIADALHDSPAPVAREFVAGYPALAFRQRMAAACRLIRAGSDEEAMRVLSAARASGTDEAVELGYCRSFCRTMEGYRHRRQGRKAEARQALAEAMNEIERYVPAARAANHTRLLELYETLDKELAVDGD